MKHPLKGLALTVVFALGAPAYADDDSSANAAAFGNQVKDSHGLILRVPIDERGNELTDAAEIRLDTGTAAATETTIGAAFDRGLPAGSQPEITAADVSADSSTNGWYSWRNHGWHNNYYYNYRPYYYNTGYYRTYN